MKTLFLTPKNVEHPAILYLKILGLMLQRAAFEITLLTIAIILFFVVVVPDWDFRSRVLVGVVVGLFGGIGIIMLGAIHELSHIFVGARLAGVNYPLLFALPDFKNPYVRFQPKSIPPVHTAIILLSGPISGSFIALVILVTILLISQIDEWSWMRVSFAAVFLFSQVIQLFPLGSNINDGTKLKKLIKENRISPQEIVRSSVQIFFQNRS